MPSCHLEEDGLLAGSCSACFLMMSHNVFNQSVSMLDPVWGLNGSQRSSLSNMLRSHLTNHGCDIAFMCCVPHGDSPPRYARAQFS